MNDEPFGCIRLACVLTPRACAKRWRLGNGKQRLDMAFGILPKAFNFRPCNGCPVGEDNDKKEREWAASTEQSKPSGKLGGNG